jgi:hypothetical protein
MLIHKHHRSNAPRAKGAEAVATPLPVEGRDRMLLLGSNALALALPLMILLFG